MPFQKGKKKTGGKVKGTPNVLTQQMRTVKQAVLDAFNELQKDNKVNLVEWGKKNPAAFYQVAAKLIPTETDLKVSELPSPTIVLKTKD